MIPENCLDSKLKASLLAVCLICLTPRVLSIELLTGNFELSERGRGSKGGGGEQSVPGIEV